MTAQIPVPTNLNVKSIMALTGAEPMSVNISNGILEVQGITQEVLDDAMVVYYADEETYYIQPLRDGKKESFSMQVYQFISGRYSVQVQQMFQALLTEASIGGLTNRIAYIQQLLDWVKTIVAANMVADDAVDAAVTPEEIEAVTLDLLPFEVTDPAVTVRGAMEIPD
jgi:hypothetical protein